MPMVDERGRLFGRVNLIDAGVGVLVLLLIPLGYVAYALFRTPVPIVTSVEQVPASDGAGYRLRVLGEDLRPYLKVSLTPSEVGEPFLIPCCTFMVESPNAGEVNVPELEPGTYDLILYDEARELLRVPAVLFVDLPFVERDFVGAVLGSIVGGVVGGPPFPPPPVVGAVKVLGWFTGLDKGTAQMLAGARTGREPLPMRIVRQQPPEPDRVPLRDVPNVVSRIEGRFRVNALLVLQCRLANDDCMVGDTLVRPGAMVTIPYAGGTIRFRVEEVHSVDTELIDVRVRFVTAPEILAGLRLEAARANSPAGNWGLTPWFVSFEETISGLATVSGTGISGTSSGTGNVNTEVNAVRAVARVPAERTVTGWKYQGEALRVGGSFTVTTSQHVVTGLIMGIRAPQNGSAVDVPSD